MIRNKMNKLILIVMGLFTSLISFAETDDKEVKIPEEKFVVVESTADDKPAGFGRQPTAGVVFVPVFYHILCFTLFLFKTSRTS